MFDDEYRVYTTPKVLINGTFDKNRISRTFKDWRVEIYCNVTPKSFKDLNTYSAVFFTGDFDKEEMYKWIGTEHLRICRNDYELEGAIFFALGIPKPLEIERRFLIEYPDVEYIKTLPNTNYVNISQAYVKADFNYHRMRKRGRDGDDIYMVSSKVTFDDMTRLEVEYRIEEEEYLDSIKNNKVLSKVRYLIVYKDKYFELDVFPFWKDKALLEIELQTSHEEFEIPPYLKVIKEVTADKEYRNFNLCKVYGEQN